MADELDLPVMTHVQETRMQVVTGQLWHGKTMIEFPTNSMIFGVVPFLVRMSKYLTLYPGDVVWMGTEGHTENIKHGDDIAHMSGQRISGGVVGFVTVSHAHGHPRG